MQNGNVFTTVEVNSFKQVNLGKTCCILSGKCIIPNVQRINLRKYSKQPVVPDRLPGTIIGLVVRKPISISLQLVSKLGNTHVKISQLVASLQTSRQQVVFARLVTSFQQVWNKLLTTCNNLVDIVRLVTRLFQQGCYNHDITILLQLCVVNLVTFLLYHDCIRLVRTTL